MSFQDTPTTHLPRVLANSLGSPRSQTEELSHCFQIGIETAALSLVRHNVVVLKLKEEDAAVLQQLQAASSAYFRSGQLLPTTPAATQQHVVLPGCHFFDYNASSSDVPESVRQPAHQAYTLLDSVSRLVLHAVCRSPHVRLHQAMLDTLLDETPLRDGIQASSALQVQQSRLAGQDADFVEAAVSSQEVLPHGLISIISAQNASRISTGGPAGSCQRSDASMLQVKNPEGKWTNVQLEADEVAVLLGATAHRATAGLLRPGWYRVVGDVHAGEGRKAAVFELRPRPDAVIDFAAAMCDAGHEVPDRYIDPISARELSEHLDSARKSQDSARSSATCVLRCSSSSGGSSISQPRKGRKRVVTGAEVVTPQPTASVQSAGIATRRSRRSSVAAASAASCGPAQQNIVESQQPMAGSPHTPNVMEQSQASGGDRQIWVEVDIMGSPPAHILSLCMQNHHGGQLFFKCPKSQILGAIFESYCEHMGSDLGQVKFMYKGKRIYGYDRPSKLQMRSNDLITVETTRVAEI